MVFLNPALAKTSGGIIGGIQAKSNWIKNMVGGTYTTMRTQRIASGATSCFLSKGSSCRRHQFRNEVNLLGRVSNGKKSKYTSCY